MQLVIELTPSGPDGAWVNVSLRALAQGVEGRAFSVTRLELNPEYRPELSREAVAAEIVARSMEEVLDRDRV